MVVRTRKVNRDKPERAFACFAISSLTPHSTVSLTLAEFDIWYNESFVIPEDVQAALKSGSSIRPGMVPVNRILSLVSSTSGTRAVKLNMGTVAVMWVILPHPWIDV